MKCKASANVILLNGEVHCSTGAANSDNYRVAVQECEGYVQMLMEFNNMGDLMRSAMTKALINPQVRSRL